MEKLTAKDPKNRLLLSTNIAILSIFKVFMLLMEATFNFSDGYFTFQLSLHKNGDIWFVYIDVSIYFTKNSFRTSVTFLFSAGEHFFVIFMASSRYQFLLEISAVLTIQ